MFTGDTRGFATEQHAQIAAIDHLSVLSETILDALLEGSEAIDYSAGITVFDPDRSQGVYSFLVLGF